MSLRSSNTTRRSRNPSCTLCCNHGIRSELKGHKHQCPFSNCDCKLCDRGRERREVMRKQVKLRRQQMKQIYSKGHTENSRGVYDLTMASSFREKKGKSTIKATNSEHQAGSRDIGTFSEGILANPEPFSARRLSINHQSSQTTPNTSPYYDYSGFPMQAVNINHDSFAYYLSLSPGSSTSLEEQSPRHHISPLFGRLNVSENSAFVKFSPPLNPMMHEGVLGTTDGWSSEIKDPGEAALALASLKQNINC